MKYNISVSGNITVELYNDRQDGEEGSESESFMVWYMIAATVVVMLAVLLLSFCLYHKRLHRKKQHHVDYVRANLPLVRPRISPPNLNGGEGVRCHVINFYRQESRRRSYISYTGLPLDDIYEQEVIFSGDFDERNRRRPQNLIDFEYSDLGEPTISYDRGYEVQSAEPLLGSIDLNQIGFSEDEEKSNGDIHALGKKDFVNNTPSPKRYIPTFQAFKNRSSIATESPSRKLGAVLPELRRSHSVQITSHFPRQECKLPHQSDNFRLLSLPKSAYNTERSMKCRQPETML